MIQMGRGGHFHLEAAELFISVSVSICPQPSLTHTLGNKNSRSTPNIKVRSGRQIAEKRKVVSNVILYRKE